MTVSQQMVTIGMVILGTMFTRFLPFLLFPPGRPALPPAVFGMLVIYCLKHVNPFAGSHGIPELLSVAFVATLHLWKRKMLLSIGGGTVCYMLLVQTVFGQ